MNKLLTIVLGTAVLLSSGQLFAADPCDTVLYENNGKSIKAGSVSYNGSLAFIDGADGLEGVISDDVDMFKKVLSKHLSNLKGARNVQITGMNPDPDREVFDNAANKFVKKPLKIIPFQTYKSGKGVMLGNNAWAKPIDLKGEDLVVLYYGALVASYAEKLNILSVNPSGFESLKDGLISKVKEAPDKIKACEDEKTVAKKDLAKLIGASEESKLDYSEADQAALQGAVDLANDVHDNPLATLAELKDAKIKLEQKKNSLTPLKKTDNNGGDRGRVLALNQLKDLIEKVEDAESILPAYIKAKIDPELKEAKAVRDNSNSTAAELEKAHDELLDVYTKAEAELLKDLIAHVEGSLGSYSADAKAILEPAIKDAKAVSDNADASVEELSDAISSLVDAKISADMKDGKTAEGEITEELLESEFVKLTKEIEKKKPINSSIDGKTRLAVVDLIESLLADYSDGARADLEKVIKDVRAIINNPNATDAELEKALRDLISAKLAADMKDGKIAEGEITYDMIKAELDRILKLLGGVPGKQMSYTLDEVKDATNANTEKKNPKQMSYTLDEVRDAVNK